jgi:diguanylate cyclase
MRLFAGKTLNRLIFISLYAVSSTAFASPSFEKQLEQANNLRSADPKKFEQILRDLDANIANATAEQLEQLRYLQAYRLAYSGQYNLAIEKATAIFEQSKNINLKYRSGLLITNSYTISRNFGASFTTLDKTLLLQKKINDTQLRNDGLIVAAQLYNQVGQYLLGKEYAEQVLNNNPSNRSRCFANNSLLEALYNLDSLPKNDNKTNELIASCSEHGEVLLANGSRIYLARKWFEQGETKKAITFLEKYLPEIEATSYPRLVGEVHSMLADYKLKSGEITDAERHASIAVAQSASIPFSHPLVISEKTLYEIAVRRNDTAAAFEHYKKYAEADKAYLTDVKARELAYQLAKHETLQKTQTIALLNQKNEVLQLEQKITAKTALITNLVLALLAVLLATLIYWSYRTKRMQMEFRRLAETDALTGISNRDHFTKQSEQALSEARKKLDPIGMIMFDLDNFKLINDQYGHATGDWVLKRVIETCKPHCRKQDTIGRLGGEEFAILLSPCDLQSAVLIAERCREYIAAIDTKESGHAFSITASFGVNNTLQSGYDFDSLLSEADQALYKSKREGRNRVSVYQKI